MSYRSSRICINSIFSRRFMSRLCRPWDTESLSPSFFNTHRALLLDARRFFFFYILIKSSGTVFFYIRLRSCRLLSSSFSSSSVSLCFVENYKRWSYTWETVVYTQRMKSGYQNLGLVVDRSVDRSIFKSWSP